MNKTECCLSCLVRWGRTEVSLQKFTASLLQNQGPVMISYSHGYEFGCLG